MVIATPQFPYCTANRDEDVATFVNRSSACSTCRKDTFAKAKTRRNILESPQSKLCQHRPQTVEANPQELGSKISQNIYNNLGPKMHVPQLPPQCLRTPCHRPRTTRIQHPRGHKKCQPLNRWIFFKKKLRHVEASTLRLGKAERLTVATEIFFGRNKHRVKDQNIKLSNVLWATSTTMAKKPWANHTSHTFRYELMEKPCFGWCLSHGSPTISIEPQLARSWNFTHPNVAYHCRPWPKTYPASQTANTFCTFHGFIAFFDLQLKDANKFQNASWEWCRFSRVQHRQPCTPGQSNWGMTDDSVWCCQLFSMRSFKGLCS